MKNTVAHVVVVVAAVVVASVLGTKMYVAQQGLFPEKTGMRGVPVAGLHKFYADVSWMLFVNYLGSAGEVGEKNVDEVIRRVEKLLRLDPNQEQYYRNGVMFIANEDPAKALELLKRGCENPNLATNAEIPFYAGFVLMHNLEKPRYEEAARYFKMSMDRPAARENSIACNAGRRYDYCLAKLKAQSDGIDYRLALVEVLYEKMQRREGFERGAGEDSGRLETRLLSALSSARAADDDYTPTKQTLDRVAEITAKVFSERHICSNCLRFYGAGEKFCAGCGHRVVVWGECPKCKAAVGGSAYCPQCGTRCSK